MCTVRCLFGKQMKSGQLNIYLPTHTVYEDKYELDELPILLYTVEYALSAKRLMSIDSVLSTSQLVISIYFTYGS